MHEIPPLLQKVADATTIHHQVHSRRKPDRDRFERGDLGRISPGCEADLVLWGCSSVEHLAWHMAVNHALVVVKRGRVVHEASPGAAVDCR